MDTLEFLQTLLPEEGVKFVARWVALENHPRGGIFMHKPFVDLDDMADAILWHAKKGNTVYHACASYKEVQFITTKSGKEVPAGRTQANALAARALWLDFDVGKEAAHSYTSKKEAVISLSSLVKGLALPTPMIVDSGNGVHAYFLLEESLEARTWKLLANKFRAVCDHFGLKYDPSRSSDIASILRPPGSFNLKNPEHPKPVVVKHHGVRRPAALFDTLFDAYLNQHDIIPEAPRLDFGGLNNDLITKVEYPPSKAEIIAQHCQQVKQFSETGGSSEPVWYAMLGLLKHCVDGEQFAHQWGQQHPDYDAGTTRAKMDQWGFGPPTCDKFRIINDSGCAGCTHACKSPIQLGHFVTENVEHTPLAVETDTTPQEVLKTGPGSPFWPERYAVRNGRVEVARPGENGVDWVPVAAPPFWLMYEIRGEENECMLHIRAEVKDGQYNDFDIPTSALASADKLRVALTANRVFSISHSSKGGFELMDFLQSQALAMQRLREETNTFTQLGWLKDMSGFLMGNKLISKEGISTKRIGKDIEGIQSGIDAADKFMTSSGTLEEYHDGVMALYGGEGKECYQYALGTALGAYLTTLVDNENWHGIPLLLYSRDSGYGKSTVAEIGLNLMCFHGASMATNGTGNFFRSMLRVYGSLPVFLDETSKQFKPHDLQDFLYSWPNGKEKGRLGADGKIRSRGAPWNNMGICTSNQSMVHQVANVSDVSPEATQVRVMEIDLQEYMQGRKPVKAQQDLATHLASNVYGLITEKVLRTIMRNADKLRDAIMAEFRNVRDALPSNGDTTARYLCYHAACSLIGLKLGRQLGAWDFSVAGVRTFIIEHIKAQMQKVAEYRVTPEDTFSAMMADFQSKLLVTTRYDSLDRRKKTLMEEEPFFRPLGPIVGRYATGCAPTKTEEGDAGRLFIAIHAINDWCKERDLNPHETRASWKNAGLIDTLRGADSKGERIVKLARGVTGKPLPATRCLEFVVAKVRGYIFSQEQKPGEIIQLEAA